MPVYIDSVNIPFRRMIMNHLMADTTAELLDMVDKIGVNRKWIQYPGRGREHFDICLGKKAKALKFGAIEVGHQKIAELCGRPAKMELPESEKALEAWFTQDTLNLNELGDKTVKKII